MAKAQGVIHRGQRMVAFLAMIVFTWAMVGCAKPTEPTVLLSEPAEAPHLLAGPIAEVSPPETLDTLKQIIDAYTPQVRVLSPRPGEVVESATVSVRFQVRGLPLFKDEAWQLGPHLHVFLDDQPYQAVYDASEPLVLEDLAPGTHTLRVFASRPWHESFKNEGAFDQRTFHVFAPTPQNEVNASAPLLTYSRPQGIYGAEPIMLDFYLTNAPLHLSAQADPKDDLHDWRIRCTVNGQSFVFDQWQPIYLEGFQPGKNWVQLELIDETGRPIDNRFNNTVRIIDYQPGGTDTLSRLVRGELDLKAVASIIDPTYTPPAPEAPLAEPTPEAIDEAEDTVTAVFPEAPAPQVEPSATQDILKAVPAPLGVDLDGADLDGADLDGADLTEPDLGAADRDEASLEGADLETPDVVEDFEPESLGLELSEPEDAAISIPVPIEDEVSPSEPESKGIDDPVTVSEPAPEAVAEPATEADSTATPDSEAIAIPDPFATNTAPGQPSQAQTQTMPSPASPMERGKGMVKRWKNWAQQQTIPGFGTTQPETTPEPPPIPVYEVPGVTDAPESLEKSAPGEATPSEPDDPTMVMPELIEPYLTQPYMTEPRLDFQPLKPGETSESDGADNEATPTPKPLAPPERPQPGLKRPYI